MFTLVLGGFAAIFGAPEDAWASSQLATALDATDGAVYAAAQLKLGATARDATGMRPAHGG